jgi:hypothetical protein
MKKRTPRKMSKHRARKRAPSPRIPLTIHSKMVRRRPHVFSDAKAKDSAAVLKNWEQIRAEERAGANT